MDLIINDEKVEEYVDIHKNVLSFIYATSHEYPKMIIISLKVFDSFFGHKYVKYFFRIQHMWNSASINVISPTVMLPRLINDKRKETVVVWEIRPVGVMNMLEFYQTSSTINDILSIVTNLVN